MKQVKYETISVKNTLNTYVLQTGMFLYES